jgi:hypothetical protein
MNTAPHVEAPMPRWLRRAVGVAAVLATLGVFALYQRPDFLLSVADQLWSCF